MDGRAMKQQTTRLTKKQVTTEARDSFEIDVSSEPDLYFALQAWEYHGLSIRDNTIEQWIEIGMAIERGDDESEG